MKTRTHKGIFKHLYNLFCIANNTDDIDKLLDGIEDESYEMLEYINQVRRRRMKNERKCKSGNDKG